ncbi:MAG: hypothetical protein GWO27_06910 [Thermoplasmata archaeon]|nr:hypothetical protein [Thermoplasmata archaeon]NIT76806.1 hypothetical protein [Thermoplasmata archaeon]NIY03177.1 hypothetical protein [Thermoplasmata archaeon]
MMPEWKRCTRCGKTILVHVVVGMHAYCDIGMTTKSHDFDAADIEDLYLSIGKKVPETVSQKAVKARAIRKDPF